MGSPAGSYSNQSGPAAVYNPTGQGQADQLWQNIAFNTLGPLATNPSSTPAGQALPAATMGAYSNIVNNPGYDQLLQATSAAPAIGYANYANALQGANASGAVPGAIAAAANNPYYTQALGGAQLGSGIGTGTAAGLAGNVPGLTSAAGQALTNAFDPQQALYNQTLNNTLQQQAAANAMSGVGGSPYGAGLMGQDLNNFNIGWNAQQIANEATGANTAATLNNSALGTGQGASTLAAASGALPSSAYTNNINNIIAAAQAGNTALGTGASTTGASLTDLLNAAGAAYNASNTQGSNVLSALSNLTNLGNNQYNYAQSLLPALQSYETGGQQASQISGNLGQMGQQELMNSMTGIGSLVGS